MRIIALGAVFQLLATGLIPFIRNMNGASFAMAAMILGFVTNIILDYTFVWIFGWGMAGAAWATIIGQAITMLAAILFFIIKKSGFYLPPFFELTSLWKNILHIAPAPFGLTFSPTVTMLVMNRFSLWYGTAQDVASLMPVPVLQASSDDFNRSFFKDLCALYVLVQSKLKKIQDFLAIFASVLYI